MITSKPHCCQTPESSCQVFSLTAPHPDFMAYVQKPFYFVLLPHYQFLSFALVSLSPVLLFQVTRPLLALIRIASFLAFISQFFPSRPQMQTLMFSFPRSYKLKERQNVKDFFDVSGIFYCSSHYTLSPQSYKTMYEIFFYFLKYRRKQLLTKTFCHGFVHINCLQIQPY